TTRELQYSGPRDDNSSATFRVMWQNTDPRFRFYTPASEIEGPGWFNQAKLSELGFDVSVPPDSKAAERHYERERLREVFAVLEFDGPAFEGWVQERARRPVGNYGLEPQATPEDLARIDRETASRLVLIDAGLDPQALR